MPFVIFSFICRLFLYSVLHSLTHTIFVISNTMRELLFLSFSDCEEVTPVHLRSVHPSSVSADSHQLPRDDLGDCERSCAQDPFGHGQAYTFPQYSLRRSLCDCPVSLELRLPVIQPILLKLEMAMILWGITFRVIVGLGEAMTGH